MQFTGNRIEGSNPFPLRHVCRRAVVPPVRYFRSGVADVAEHTVNHEEMLAYGRTNDPWPFHMNPEAATRSPFSDYCSGGYTITLMYRLSHEIMNQPDRTWAFLGGFDWHLKFLEPVPSGDRLHERITILEKRLSSKPGRGIVKHP